MSSAGLYAIGREFWGALFGVMLRTSALIVAGWCVSWCLRSRAAALRHLVWKAVLCGVLMLPALETVAPAVRPPQQMMIRAKLEAVSPLLRAERRAEGNVGEERSQTVPLHKPQQWPWLFAASVTYGLVVLVLMLRLGGGYIRLRRMVGRSEPIFDGDARELERQVWLESLSWAKPTIRESAEVCVPIAAGVHEISILLPRSWRDWPRERLRAALIHEMEHVRRGDPQTAVWAELARCVFWMHPLIPLLQKHIAGSAEEACDEAALRHIEPEAYARALIAFAGDVAGTGKRLVALAVAGNGLRMAARIERIFATKPKSGQNFALLRMVLVTLFVPVLYLAAATDFDVPETAQDGSGQSFISVGTREGADRLEVKLMQDPDNRKIRDSLIVFYLNDRDNAALTRHLLWLVDKHPEDPLTATATFFPAAIRPGSRSDARFSAADATAFEDYERVETAWERALQEHPDSAEVMYHAAFWFEREDPERALALFAKAWKTSGGGREGRETYVGAIAPIYGAAVMLDVSNHDADRTINGIEMDRATAARMVFEVDSSTDPDFLSKVGTVVVQLGREKEAEIGLAFIRKAVNLEPGNSRWQEALQSAEAEPIRRANLRAVGGRK